jgi:hypothetical protein
MAKGLKTGGRKKGSINKISSIDLLAKELMIYILDGYFSKFTDELDKLNGSDFILLFLKIYGLKNTELESIKSNDELLIIFKNKINKL